MTRSEAETKRRKAVEFLRRIGQDEDAERFEAMTPQEYAEHKGAELLENPRHRRVTDMARAKSKADLQAELEEANDYIEELEERLDDIAGIAADEDQDDQDLDEDDLGE